MEDHVQRISQKIPVKRGRVAMISLNDVSSMRQLGDNARPLYSTKNNNQYYYLYFILHERLQQRPQTLETSHQ